VRPPTPRLDQLLPNFSYGDAIGNHVQSLRRMFREGGFPAEVYAQMRHPRVRALSRYYSDYLFVDDSENCCFFHFSIGSALSDFFGRLRARKFLIYHNITPPEYLRGVNRRAEFECRRGREELRRLAGVVELAIADSEFNRLELEEMGFPRTELLPIVVDFDGYAAAPSRQLLRRFDDDWVNVLHVSRFVPNKRIEDVVKSFAVFRKIKPRSRLFLVGTDVSFENYSKAVRDLVERLGLDEVYFPGHVDLRDLCTYYRLADLYLLMSEHEGFCVPLLEAMHFGVPVIAYGASAVPHTLGRAGLIVGEKRFDEIAELMALVASDAGLRRRLVAAGKERLRDFAPAKIEARLRELLDRCGITSQPRPG
jgi:glycosyltransferase involved in cell wall biosynthesis